MAEKVEKPYFVHYPPSTLVRLHDAFSTGFILGNGIALAFSIWAVVIYVIVMGIENGGR